MTCNQWDIAVIPFPFVDSNQAKPRPVLILSQSSFVKETNHTIAAMITSSQHSHWKGDTEITELATTGLNKPSLIRLKLFTLDMRFAPRVIGALSDQDRDKFHQHFVEAIF